MNYRALLHKQIDELAAKPGTENPLIFLYTFTHEVFGVGRVTWKEARELAGFSLSEAARGTGISIGALKRYEAGETSPYTQNALKLAEFYDIDLNCINTRCEAQKNDNSESASRRNKKHA